MKNPYDGGKKKTHLEARRSARRRLWPPSSLRWSPGWRRWSSTRRISRWRGRSRRPRRASRAGPWVRPRSAGSRVARARKRPPLDDRRREYDHPGVDTMDTRRAPAHRRTPRNRCRRGRSISRLRSAGTHPTIWSRKIRQAFVHTPWNVSAASILDWCYLINKDLLQLIK